MGHLGIGDCDDLGPLAQARLRLRDLLFLKRFIRIFRNLHNLLEERFLPVWIWRRRLRRPGDEESTLGLALAW